MIKTYSAKPSEVTRAWHLLDASQMPLGRLASLAATLLLGKHKPMFTSHIDCGDYVVIINSSKIQVTGNKMNDKKYYRHSGYPGNLKTATLAERMAKDANKVVEHAVRGMLPDNKLRSARLMRLKVYKSSDHQHSAQQPQPYKIGDK